MRALCFSLHVIDFGVLCLWNWNVCLGFLVYIPLTLMCCAYETEMHVFCFLGLPISETPGLMDAGPDSANGFHSGVDQHRHSQCKLTCLNWQAFIPTKTKTDKEWDPFSLSLSTARSDWLSVYTCTAQSNSMYVVGREKGLGGGVAAEMKCLSLCEAYIQQSGPFSLFG